MSDVSCQKCGLPMVAGDVVSVGAYPPHFVHRPPWEDSPENRIFDGFPFKHPISFYACQGCGEMRSVVDFSIDLNADVREMWLEELRRRRDA